MNELPDYALPVELEREIFELASWNDHVTGYSLIRVARRVYEWVEPSLYRVLIVYEGDYRGERPTPSSPFLQVFKDLLAARGFGAIARQAKFVHHFMYTGNDITELKDILLLCTNIVDLALWTIPVSRTDDLDSIMESLGSLRPQKISISSTLISLYPKWLSLAPLTQSLTHLDCFGLDGPIWDDGWENLRDLSALTSLAVAGNNISPTISATLQKLKNIQLVIDALEGDVSYIIPPDAPWYVDDPRFVFCEYPRPTVDCWLKGTVGGDDIWVLGEIEQRKKKERLLSNYCQRSLSR
ncbi:hypothetical protein CPB83DRAFT_908688 [Crepidotus variabilis]|uniref:Uncharacterized protein n=1 Tax=Crepidotus variabilis TaxID=179855 RepID=A0A9P6JMT6_9AGAR|nr:hypothetical protein CPB83DRAFT_908688 [Crepidotus variabilis]